MKSSRPYLIRALYEWILDNDCTPHLLVSVDYPGVCVPEGFASDGQIVLNISPSAVRNMHMDNDAVDFEGRFGGVAHALHIPCQAVMAIYARENGQGMVFEVEMPEGGPDGTPPTAAEPAPDDGGDSPKPSGRPSLKVVK